MLYFLRMAEHMNDDEQIKELKLALKASEELRKRNIEQYIKVLKIDPKAKYMLIVSSSSGLSREDLVRLKLNDNFQDEILLVHGNPNKLIRQIKITKKQV